MSRTVYAIGSFLRDLVSTVASATRIALAWLVSMVLPERFWRPLSRAIGRAIVWLRPGWKQTELTELEQRLGIVDPGARLEILTDRIALGHESRLYGLREYRPGGSQHQIQISGTEMVHEGLAAGRGVILWVGQFVFASLTTKIAFQQSGFSVSHLSRPTHGFSTSRLGIRWLNPIWTRIEERYLCERVVVNPERQISAMRNLRERLADNEVISIALGEDAVKVAAIPFLEAELRIATGPITLAAATGAPLVPVFTVRDANRQFRVEVQSPLAMPIEKDRQVRSTLVAEAYADRLTHFVQKYPGQWLG